MRKADVAIGRPDFTWERTTIEIDDFGEPADEELNLRAREVMEQLLQLERRQYTFYHVLYIYPPQDEMDSELMWYV